MKQYTLMLTTEDRRRFEPSGHCVLTDPTLWELEGLRRECAAANKTVRRTGAEVETLETRPAKDLTTDEHRKVREWYKGWAGGGTPGKDKVYIVVCREVTEWQEEQ